MRKENQILLFLFILLQCHIGHALRCYSCIAECTQVTVADCASDQDQCVTKEIYNNGNLQSQQKTCGKSQDCNASNPDPTLITRCCNTDLCNSANISTTAVTSSAPAAGPATRAPGTILTCYSCNLLLCPIKNSVTCKPDELCVTKYFTFLGLSHEIYGCSNATDCSKQTSELYSGSSVSMDNKCCGENLCNRAVGLKLPFITAVGTVLLVWITKLC